MAEATTSQMFNVVIQIMDKQTPPQPARVDGVPVWASADATIIQVNPAADGMSGTVPCISAGVSRFTITADADLGSGVQTITGVSEDITVTNDPALLASTFVITMGAPVAKAAAPAPGP